MRPEEIRGHLHKQQFRPIRVFVSDGSHYDVPHPDFMLVSQREIIIGISPAPDQLPESKAYVDPVHITRIEPIDGKARRKKTKG